MNGRAPVNGYERLIEHEIIKRYICQAVDWHTSRGRRGGVGEEQTSIRQTWRSRYINELLVVAGVACRVAAHIPIPLRKTAHGHALTHINLSRMKKPWKIRFMARCSSIFETHFDASLKSLSQPNRLSMLGAV